MNAEDRTRLQRILASFDEAGLVALANKGLVRRAQKDLEAGGLTNEETDSAVLVRGPGWVVTMPPEGPAHATDDTKASGVTRQILTATIYLRDQWAIGAVEAAAPERAEAAAPQRPDDRRSPPTEAPEPTAGESSTLLESLLSLSLDDLQKWAGKTVLRDVLALAKGGLEAEVEVHTGVTIRLVRHEVEARLLPGPARRSARAVLDAILTTAPRAHHKRWVVAAVLAFQQSRGRTFETAAPAVPPEEAGAARTRQQVLAAARDLLEGMVSTGLAHPSARMTERLFTLSVSALAVHLPRLARLLRSLADDVSLVLARDAAADTGRLFDRVCRTHALARALAAAGPQTPVALAGQHRTQYDPAGDPQLAGVGVHAWQTPSGFEGLTVLFWDRQARRFLTWSVSRPTGGLGRMGIDQAYRGEAPWSGGGPPERLGRSQFTLRNARANALGRLSGSESSSVVGLEPTDPAALDFAGRLFTNWRALLSYARSQYPLGLKEKNPLDRVVVVRPAQWGERFFDELQQQFCWRLQDDAGNALALTLPWAAVNESAVEFLEALNPARDRLTAVVCRLAFGRDVLLEPLSVLGEGTPQGHRVLNPAFDRALITSRHSALLERLRQKYGRDRIATAMTADDEGEAEDGELGSLERVPLGVRARLTEAERVLLQIAEAGLGRLQDEMRGRLRRLAAEADRAGLGELGRGLAEFDRPGAAAGAVLANGYLCRLHREALSLPPEEVPPGNTVSEAGPGE
jgi:hypothetical protein